MAPVTMFAEKNTKPAFFFFFNLLFLGWGRSGSGQLLRFFWVVPRERERESWARWMLLQNVEGLQRECGPVLWKFDRRKFQGVKENRETVV